VSTSSELFSRKSLVWNPSTSPSKTKKLSSKELRNRRRSSLPSKKLANLSLFLIHFEYFFFFFLKKKKKIYMALVQTNEALLAILLNTYVLFTRQGYLMLKRLDTQQATALQSVELFKFLFFQKRS